MRKLLLPVAAVAAAAFGLAACDKPRTHSAYINSGQSATPAMPASSTPSESPAETVPQPVTSYPPGTATATSQAPAVSDTVSPAAPAPQAEAAQPAK